MASTLVSTLVATVALDHNGNDKDKHSEAVVGRATDSHTQPANTKRPGLPIHSFNHLSKETENVDEMIRFYTKNQATTVPLELLKEYGIMFAESVVPQTGQRQLFFFDPDGNGIEICDCDVEPPPFEEEDDDHSAEGQNGDGGRSSTEALQLTTQLN